MGGEADVAAGLLDDVREIAGLVPLARYHLATRLVYPIRNAAFSTVMGSPPAPASTATPLAKFAVNGAFFDQLPRSRWRYCR
jgi:hypothetical protein